MSDQLEYYLVSVVVRKHGKEPITPSTDTVLHVVSRMLDDRQSSEEQVIAQYLFQVRRSIVLGDFQDFGATAYVRNNGRWVRYDPYNDDDIFKKIAPEILQIIYNSRYFGGSGIFETPHGYQLIISRTIYNDGEKPSPIDENTQKNYPQDSLRNYVMIN